MARSELQPGIISEPASTHSPYAISPLHATQSFELHSTTESGTATPVALPPRQDFSLPRADGGKDAWLVLAACFFLEALVWGFPFAFGVFNEYYAEEPLFADSKSIIPAIGTTQTVCKRPRSDRHADSR